MKIDDGVWVTKTMYESNLGDIKLTESILLFKYTLNRIYANYFEYMPNFLLIWDDRVSQIKELWEKNHFNLIIFNEFLFKPIFQKWKIITVNRFKEKVLLK